MFIRFKRIVPIFLTLFTGLFLLSGAVQILPTETLAADNSALKQQQDRQTQIDDYKTRQKNLQLEIKKGRREVKSFTRKESKLIKRLNQVDQSLNNSRKRAAALGKEIQALEERISGAAAASIKLQQRIRRNEKYVAQRLVAMYKMNRLGKISFAGICRIHPRIYSAQGGPGAYPDP